MIFLKAKQELPEPLPEVKPTGARVADATFVEDPPVFPEIGDEELSRRDQLGMKKDKKNEGKRGRPPANKKSGEEAMKEKQPRHTAAKTKAKKNAQESDEKDGDDAKGDTKPRLRRTKRHLEDDDDQPEVEEREHTTPPKRRRRLRPLADCAPTPTAGSAPKAKAKAKAKGKAKAAASAPKAKAKGKAKASKSRAKMSKEEKDVATESAAHEEEQQNGKGKGKGKAATVRDTGRVDPPAGETPENANLREEVTQEVFNALMLCWKAGECEKKGKHAHAMPVIDGKVANLSSDVYWTRNAVGVKKKMENKKGGSHICYFSRHTACNASNIILAKRWVSWHRCKMSILHAKAIAKFCLHEPRKQASALDTPGSAIPEHA